MEVAQGRSLGSQVKLVGILLALVILVVFIALNFDKVDVDLLVTSQDVQLGFALLVSALLGFVVGFLARG
jgi:uncharacterized integral membrane protein